MQRKVARTRSVFSFITVAAVVVSGCGKREGAPPATQEKEVVTTETEGRDQGAAGPTSDPVVKLAEAALPTEAPAASPADPAALELGKSGDATKFDALGIIGGEAAAGGRYASVARKRKAGAPAFANGNAVAQDRRGTSDDEGGNTEDYQDYGVNDLIDTAEDRLSTFAIDVDTASYVIARRKILEGDAPPKASVRVEEFVNYFRYAYAGPTDQRPFAVYMDAAPSPFAEGKHLLRVGIQAKQLSIRERKPAHLVFLVDVSGSMSSPDKLALAQRSLRILVDNLRDGDTVALVTYAGSTRVVLEPTDAAHKAEILSAIEDLRPGGSTAMASGIELAYELAARNLGEDSVSRVIILSDGDANVGNTDHESILALIAGHVKEGVTLSTIGFGMGNYKDTMMEQLANQGNGNYYYIDGISQARRVFQEQAGGTLEVVAKDVKIQVELNPKAVKRYRLVGYENRDIADEDFRNDKVDAGEIGAGHTVTALYEVELAPGDGALATVRLRAKAPAGEQATEYAYPMDRPAVRASFDAVSADLRFAVAVMAAAEILRKSPHAANWSLHDARAIAAAATPAGNAERAEFVDLLSRVSAVSAR
jgi:Ca-activated chloride channel family protein